MPAINFHHLASSHREQSRKDLEVTARALTSWLPVRTWWQLQPEVTEAFPLNAREQRMLARRTPPHLGFMKGVKRCCRFHSHAMGETLNWLGLPTNSSKAGPSWQGGVRSRHGMSSQSTDSTPRGDAFSEGSGLVENLISEALRFDASDLRFMA